MKTVYITGSSILNESNQERITQQISESFMSALKNFSLGNLLSIFKIGPQPSKEKEDEYTAKRKEWADNWKNKRAKELEEDMNDKIRVRAQNFEKNELHKMQKHDIERAKITQQRKIRDQEHAEYVKRMNQISKKLSDWPVLGGPMTEEYYNQLMANADKLYTDSTPADVRAFADVKKVIADITRDDKGNFVNDPKQWKQNLVDRGYGKDAENLLNDHPELKKAIQDFQQKKPNEKDFEASVNNFVSGVEWKDPAQMDKDMEDIDKYLEGRQTLGDALSQAKQDQKKAINELKTIDKIKQDSEKAQEKYNEIKNLSPEQYRNELIRKLGNLCEEQTDDNGTKVKKFNPNLDPESGAYSVQVLKKLGLKENEINNLTPNSIESKLKEMDIAKFQDALDTAKEGCQQKIAAYTKDMQDKYSDKKSKAEGSEVKKAENALKTFDSEHTNLKETCMDYNPNIPDDGTPLTPEQVNMTKTAIEQRKKAIQNAGDEAKRLYQEAQTERDERTAASKTKEAYDKLNSEQKKELDNVSSNLDQKVTTNGSITIKGKDGKEYEIHKPKSDSPNYDDEMKLYNAEINKKIATMKIGEKPTISDPDNITFNELKEIKQWEANKRAKTSARKAATDSIIALQKEKDPNSTFSEEDAWDMLDDKEWMQDVAGNELIDEPNEGQDDEDITPDEDTTKAESEANTKVEELKTQLKNAQTDEEKSELENKLKEAEDKLKQAKQNSSTFKNPAKIWHRKKKKNGEGSTKRYYNKEGDSISTKEFKDKVKNFKERKANEPQNNSRIDDRPLIFEKRAFTFTPIGKVKHNK